MPQPPKPITDDARAAVLELLNDSTVDDDHDTYELPPGVATAPLLSANVGELVEQTLTRVEQEHLVFPDAENLIEQAVVALLKGNLVLHGPPGTGKTRLADLLAQSFDCGATIETGTPDWSTYDVIGGLRPARSEEGAEILQPWLGHIPRAALRCADVVGKQLVSKALPQAHWLIIDELSRADIDKAIGPAYTALGADRADRRKIRLWFEDEAQRSTVTLPERFRIIGTMNDVDTAFVTQLSQGLQRRFEFVLVDVPAKDQVEQELAQVTRQAFHHWARLYGDVAEGDREGAADEFLKEPRAAAAMTLLEGLITFLRWDAEGPRWPVGSAQLREAIGTVLIRAMSNPELDDLTDAVDQAVATSIIKQTSALTEEQLAAIVGHLEGLPLPRSRRALEVVRKPQLTHE